MPGEQAGSFPIFEALQAQRQAGLYRFHVPAHSACPAEYWSHYDLTELPGLDHLSAPRGCIEQAQALAAKTFLAGQTYFLVNGSSAGLAAAVFAFCRRGEKLLLGRNCHRSVAAGLIFSGARPIFMPVPETPHGIPLNLDAGAVEAALAGPAVRPEMIVVTSPSYWGVCSDLPGMAGLARRAAVPLVVDEAHGGHFIFHPGLPDGAALSGADLWVNSAHKTMGALTPGAYLHLRRNSPLNIRRLAEALALLQTTSPPYPVLLSLDLGRGWLAERGETAYGEALVLALQARRRINDLARFRCLEQSDLPAGLRLDPLRLTIYWEKLGLHGYRLGEMLHSDYGIEIELAGNGYIVALVHPGLPGEAISALCRALQEVEKRYGPEKGAYRPGPYPLPRQRLTPREALEAPARQVPLRQAAGLTAAQLVTPFPPGVPVLYPGEEIPAELTARLEADLREGVHMQDLIAGEQPLLAVINE